MPVDVAVRDLDQVLAAPAVERRKMLGDDHRAVTPARTADGHVEVRLALGHVLGKEVVEQRDQPAVEGLELAAGRCR